MKQVAPQQRSLGSTSIAEEYRAVGLAFGKRRDKPAWRRRWKSSTSKE